jgi:hypothetical protein
MKHVLASIAATLVLALFLPGGADPAIAIDDEASPEGEYAAVSPPEQTLAAAGPCLRSPSWVCDGDVDGNGVVNPTDVGIVQAHYGSTEDYALCNYDLDCNKVINPVDAGIVQSLFGTCDPPRDVCRTPFAPGNIFSCYSNTPVYEYDRFTGERVGELSEDVHACFVGKFGRNGLLYVTDTSDNEVLAFDTDSRELLYVWWIGDRTQGFDIGSRTGRVYVAKTAVVRVFKSDGVPIVDLPYDNQLRVSDLAVDEDRERLYLSTLHWNRVVYIMDLDGNEITRWGVQNGVSNSPWGIDVGPDGTVYVGIHHSHKLVAISPEGQELWSSTHPDLVSRVSEVEVAPDGTIWVQEEDAPWIARFDPEGTPLPRFDTAGPSGYMIAWRPPE